MAGLWRKQCTAARRLKVGLGSEVAVTYLLGDKLPRFLAAAQENPEVAADVPAFVAEATSIFERHEIDEHFPGVRYLRSAATVTSREAADLLKQMRELLTQSYGDSVLISKGRSTHRTMKTVESSS